MPRPAGPRRNTARIALAATAAAVIAGCPASKEEDGPKDVEFGLDERPSNVTCLAPGRPPTDFDVELAPAFGSLTFASAVALVPHPSLSGRWYVVEQGGSLVTFEAGDSAATTAYSRSVTVGPSGEGGLLGFAFHPEFDLNGRAFVSYTDTDPSLGFTSRILEVTSADGGLTFTAAAAPLFSLEQPYSNHNGGTIAFGPDGYLYTGFGDGGSGGDPLGAGQDTRTLLGKILRIDVDSASPYAIPPDNPFAGSDTEAPEIYAWGFRNPWKLSFDPATGELWVGDVGQDDWEEVDRVELGGNYGWNVREGAHCFPPGANCDAGGLIDPVVEHPQPQYQSITGGFVYRGTAIPALAGVYLYGDYVTGAIHGVFHDEVTGEAVPRLVLNPGADISSFGQGLDGEVYVVEYGGEVLQIVPAAGAPASPFPALLSGTGCVDPGDPRVPATGLVPYDVSAPLWSDAAEKRRWMALPDGTTIDVDAATGDWAFPEGTVLMKEFALDGRRIETRLLVLHTDGNWAGYTYEWDEAETDASLLPAGKTRDVAGQLWGYPSRAECLQCHTSAAGRSLGLETRQLNRDFLYPGDLRANQIDTLEHIGMFSAPPARLDPLPAFDGAEPLELRARSYLHANCSNCHQPGGTGQGSADFRFTTAFSDMQVCGVEPNEGDLGVAGAQLLVPGDPASSLISLRMKALDSNRMPDVGTRAVDPEGTALVDGWIEGIASCP